MSRLFAVIRSRGPAWNDAMSMDDQVEWKAHAVFMDRLVDEGFIALGGPLEGTRDVLLVVRAADETDATARLDADPWVKNGLLVAKHVFPWRLRLGALR